MFVVSVARGIAVANGDVVNARNDPIRDAGQKIGAFRYTHQEGYNAVGSDFQVLGLTRVIGGGTTTCMTQNYDQSVRTTLAKYAGSDFDTAQDQCVIRAKHNAGATNIGGDTNWIAVIGIYVIALMYDKTGAMISGAASYPSGYLTSDRIVADILVWLCPEYDPASATIDATTFQIDQFAYPTGARPSDLFDDLMLTSSDSWPRRRRR